MYLILLLVVHIPRCVVVPLKYRLYWCCEETTNVAWVKAGEAQK